MNGLPITADTFLRLTFFVFSTTCPSVRLAALSHLPNAVYLHHDSIFLVEDGPTHQPIEHLAIMRATPNLDTYRPQTDWKPSVYAQALSRHDGPSALILIGRTLIRIERGQGLILQKSGKARIRCLNLKAAKSPS